MKNFTRWFITFAATLTGFYFAQTKNIFNVFFENDISYICLIVTVLFFVFSVFVGVLAYKVDKLIDFCGWGTKLIEINRQLDIAKYFSEAFLLFGLLGTLIGLSFSMYGALSEINDVKSIINQLKVGCSTAFYTTIVGMVASFLLSLQIFVLEYDIKNNQ